MTETEHPARAASKASMAAVTAGDREAWLSLFADDGVVQDPVGVSPLDPTGLGHRGADAIAAFWDSTIAPNAVRFEIAHSYAAGSECANVGEVITTLPDGSVATAEGVFVYAVNADGKLVSLRAFWEFDQLRFEAAP